MSERGVMFSRPMVEALACGRKTQTRRLATSPLRRTEVGDVIWVREHVFLPPKEISERDVRDGADTWPALIYAQEDESAGRDMVERCRWRSTPGIHMPRKVARIFLDVTEVRFQPLNELTDEDAIAEGIVEHETCGWHVPGIAHPMKAFPILSRSTPREMYAALWDTLHGSGEWLGNPDVVAITFTVRK